MGIVNIVDESVGYLKSLELKHQNHPAMGPKGGGHGSMAGAKKGDIVGFKDVVDVGDENARMVLLEDPDGGRVKVEDLVDMAIRPTAIYNVEDLVLLEKGPKKSK